ncbi:unnamed protein product [Oncorhynchus mykiss]|uniref:Reverse transcriptase domain-containing protein n=1 Tax=Oncorhynchus mykiss TaxID=8022 RepID=A0A060YVV3_ONCMY|nr:unnamed protein product [Oncorhynchus mykiss]
MPISVFSINARGICNILKRKSLFLYCKGKSADFYFIQETHACSIDTAFWKCQWGNDIWFSFGTNRSAGQSEVYKVVVLAHGTSQRFDIGRGIRQGCPISPFVFLLVTQIMALHIKKGHFQGVSALGNEFKLCQLADDTTIFLRDRNEVSKAVSCIEDFSLVLGLKININKSVLFPLKDCVLQEVYGIPIKDKVTYLGIVICKDEKQRSELNFIEKTKKKLNLWLMRGISLHGRVLLSKAEGLSRSGYPDLFYVSLSFDLHPKIVKDFDKILYHFIWRNKPHYLRKDILTNTQEQGGLEVLDFNTLNNTFKIHWILKYVKNQNSILNVFPEYLFDSVGGLEFLLQCNFDINKIPVKLANFHKQAILAWILTSKHNFPLTDTFYGTTKIYDLKISLFFS